MLAGACWLAVVGALGVLALQMLGGTVGRWVTPAQALTPWLAPWVFVAALVAALAGWYAVASVGAMVALGYLALVVPLVFPADLPEAAWGTRLRVTHANLLYSNPSIDEAIDALTAADADVIAVSELTPEFAAAIERSRMGVRYPYVVARQGSAAVGLGVWSRVPISAGDPVPGSSMSLTVDVEIDGEPARLVVAHPLPPLFDGERWTAEIGALAADHAELARTVLVADLNVSFFHPPFRRFVSRTGLTDVHHALGKGFSVSWPTDRVVPPFVRLDHALVGRDLTAIDIVDHAVPGGDHRAFTVTVGWAG